MKELNEYIYNKEYNKNIDVLETLCNNLDRLGNDPSDTKAIVSLTKNYHEYIHAIQYVMDYAYRYMGLQ